MKFLGMIDYNGQIEGLFTVFTFKSESEDSINF